MDKKLSKNLSNKLKSTFSVNSKAGKKGDPLNNTKTNMQILLLEKFKHDVKSSVLDNIGDSNWVYDPFKGMKTENMTENEKRIELTKNSCLCVESAIEDIVQNTFDQARKNQLYKFSDSFGTNHSVENSAITVAWCYSIWDKNIDDYPYEQDNDEPVSKYFKRFILIKFK